MRSLKIWGTILAVSAALVSSAHAAPAAPKKAKKVIPTSSTTVNAAPVAVEDKARKEPAQFSWTTRESSVDMDARAELKRDETIGKLKNILPTIGEGPQKAELIFRLSELYTAKSKFLHMHAMQIWDAQLDAWNKSGAKGEAPKLEQVAELTAGQSSKSEALKLYRQILERYPDYPRKDEVLYNLGSALYDQGDKKDGVAMYWKLLKQFPNSDFSPDAWLQLGEHFFNANKLSEAVKAYSKAAETKKPRIYSFALYKLAWCDYNLQEYDNALTKFREVIAYAKSQKETKGGAAMAERDRIQLTEEALSDMVRVYSNLDAVDEAFNYYTQELGAERAAKYLQRLALLYHDNGKFAVEIQTYEELNARYPYAAEAPQNQTAIMNAYAQVGKNDRVRREVRRLIDLYSPNGVWANHNVGNTQVLEQAFKVVEAELAGLVTEQHRAAQSTKLVETYLLARDIYKEYLDKFTNSLNSYKFRFYYSEILFELKEFEAAAAQYASVVNENRNGEFTKAAAYAAVLSWEKVVSGVKEELGERIDDIKQGKNKGALQKLERLQDLTKGQAYTAEPLLPAEKSLADACDLYTSIAPTDPEIVKVKFKSARLYYIHNHFEEAAQRFGEIIDHWPNDELARLSAESIVQSFNVREDWAQLNVWSRKFEGNKALMADAKFKKKIGEFVEGASFNEIHFVVEPKGDAHVTADRYSAFVAEFPHSKYALVALYNAMVNYDNVNVLEKAIATADKILVEYKDVKLDAETDAAATDATSTASAQGSQLPKAEVLREKTLFLRASFAERLAQFAQAAALYEAYVAEFKDGSKVSDALFNAALYREGLGEFDKAIANYTAYVTRFPASPDVADINWRMGLILEKKNDYNAAYNHFVTYGRTYAKTQATAQVCADFRAAKALSKLGREKEARVLYSGLLTNYSKLSDADKTKGCAAEAGATAAFYGIEPDYEAYTAITLSGGEDQMARNLVKKLDMVDSLQKRYTQVLSLGHGDYGIASLYRIGAIYQQLAQAIFATQCPKRLDADQCGIYQAALQEKAFPLEEKAIEAFDKAMSKAYELGIYNEWLAKTQEALRTYEPDKFPDVHAYDMMAGESIFRAPELVASKTEANR